MIVAAVLSAVAVWLLFPSPGSLGSAAGRSRPPATDMLGAALAMDLLAAALAAGSTMPDALRAVAGSGATSHGDYLEQVALRLRGSTDLHEAWAQAPSDLEPLRRVVELVMAAGVPSADLLRAGARDLRRRCAAQAQVQAARLGVRLVLPLGLCALPAFVAWSVMPVVLGLGGQLLR